MKKWFSFWRNIKSRILSILKPSKEALTGAEEKGRTTPKGIVEWMERTGVSLQELAQMTGYDKTTIPSFSL